MPAFKSVVLSGKPMSGKSTLNARLRKALRWRYLSVGGLWRQRWEKEHPRKEVDFDEWWGGTSLEDNRRMDRRVKKMVEVGGVVADLRYPQKYGKNVFRIFVTADLDVRAARAKQHMEGYRNRTVNEIRKMLVKREEDELRVGKKLYGIDYRDPGYYHIVLNSGILTVDEELSAVMPLLNPTTARKPKKIFAKNIE
jgi:cytidylate kinase